MAEATVAPKPTVEEMPTAPEPSPEAGVVTPSEPVAEGTPPQPEQPKSTQTYLWGKKAWGPKQPQKPVREKLKLQPPSVAAPKAILGPKDWNWKKWGK